MKNNFKLSIAFVLTFVCGFAQTEIELNMSYAPETEYRMTTQQEMETKATYIAPKEFLDQLKQSGVENPTFTESQSTSKSICVTGKMAGKSMPISIEYLDVAGEKSAVPSGTVVYGTVKIGEMPEFDSIYSTGMDEQMKELVLKSATSAMSQLEVPHKKLKIGESFKHSSPISIPLGNSRMDLEIVTTYKLISIDNGIAKLDITQVYEMKTKIEDMGMKATGTGTGHMTYDLAKNFFISSVLNNEMTMKMKIDKDISVDISILQKTVQKTEVLKK